MSTPWVVAAGVLTLLVAVLSTALVMVMTRVSELESRLSRVQQQVRSLQRGRTPARAPAPPPVPAASVVVMLEAGRGSDLALADDIRRSGGVSLDVPTTVYVADDDTGRGMAEGLALEVSAFYREVPLSEGFPSVVVLDEAGAVLASGSPSTVAELESLVTRQTHSHSTSMQ